MEIKKRGHPQSAETRLKISLARKGKIPNGRLGKKHTEETKRKISKSPKLNGSGRYNWKGDDVKYPGLHSWLTRHLGKPNECWNCDEPKGRFEWANISHEYKRDFSDYARLCSSCHVLYDKGSIKLNLKRPTTNEHQ